MSNCLCNNAEIQWRERRRFILGCSKIASDVVFSSSKVLANLSFLPISVITIKIYDLISKWSIMGKPKKTSKH